MARFVGGDPLLGFVQYEPVSDHDHVGFMVWPQDPDGVCRQSWCSECGQEWHLRSVEEEQPDGSVKSVPKQWVPIRVPIEA